MSKHQFHPNSRIYKYKITLGNIFEYMLFDVASFDLYNVYFIILKSYYLDCLGWRISRIIIESSI